MTSLALTRPADRATGLALVLAGCIVAAALAAGLLPVTVSIIAVFLFAGPHNWVEARYFLTRLPARWGKLRPFFALSLGGIVALSVGFAAVPLLARRFLWDETDWLMTQASWNTALVLWIATLAELRSRHNPRRDWAWIWPAAFALIALAWLAPFGWSLALVYLHPLLALWILDRELSRQGSEHRAAYHRILVCLPLCLLGLWWQLGHAPDLASDDALTLRIVRHAGGDQLEGVSTHFLVAGHAFLELTHYAVWLLAIPWCTGQGLRTDRMPLARRSLPWRQGIQVAFTVGAAFVLILWAGFVVDYPLTRDIYFTLAIAHVLAEVPFLLRAL